ncbi:MAG: hypothetical protein AAGJ35_08850, partial [Myxococcota bacterium]
KLDHLSDLPRYVLPGHFQTTFDDKSGYQHVLLHPSSQAYFGLEWEGIFFVFRTLPIGWKASAYLYHNLGWVVSSAARSLGVPVSQYIDDRHVGQVFSSPLCDSHATCRERAEAASYIMCSMLIEAGHFVAIGKSQFTPSTTVRFLGFLCDSSRQAFFVPEDKREKFANLRENMLSSKVVSLKTLQRFAGKVVSFSLAIPGCKLYVREVFKCISRLGSSSRPLTEMKGDLRAKVSYWRFIDHWPDCLPWRLEHHTTVKLFCDASKKAWGGVLFKDGQVFTSRDYWFDNSYDINTLEARASLHSLVSFQRLIVSSRVDVNTDSRRSSRAWQNQGCQSSEVNEVLKRILECCRRGNFSLDMHYVPSVHNPADTPSRRLSDLDCMLSEGAWGLVERFYGPHTFDLMSLDSNCQKDRAGRRLPHFTPCPTPESSGTNVFAQRLPSGHNIYVFPPFVLVPPLLKYIIEQDFHGSFTIIVPDLQPRRFWWALLHSFVVDRKILGRKGQHSVLLFPSNSSHGWSSKGLQWDLWALRCVC